eukprot:gb/GFBE01010031.1/.p1 GENE.gb/GFBE01010031.1/~~gb/GFBE01010031.1/.p1  ORF type:complete len:214 (+),score=59.84 gb/GFBE01010031.1/:1-642(+)
MGKNKTTKPNKKDKGARAVARTKEEQEAEDAAIAAQVKEIEERLQVFSVEMKQVEGKVKHCMIEARRAELTEKEIEPMADESKIYRQVGKMFILQPKPALTRSLKAQCALKSVEAQSLRQAYSKIQEKVRSEAAGLKELIGEERMKALFSQDKSNEGSGNIDIPGKAKEDGMMPLFGKAGNKASTQSSDSAGTAEKTEKTEPAESAAKGSVEV